MTDPGNPPPYTLYNNRAKSPLLLVADHASVWIPPSLHQLGVADWVLKKHVAWDIGSDKLAQFLADELDSRAVLAGFSRLVIDPNRHPDDPSSVPEVSDGITIPGNVDLDERQKTHRIRSFFDRYHDAIAAKLAEFAENKVTPAVISVHTFSPVIDQAERPWHIGIMWDKDPRIPVPLIERLRQNEGVCVGDNVPYSGRHPHDFTIDHHAEAAGLPHVGIEVRQDLVTKEDGARRWANILAEGLEDILADAALYQVYGSSGECTSL